jgi:Holliday junction resolvasome RuvABC endonuclease subunit
MRISTVKPVVPTCRACGCTEDHACRGGCAWADEGKTICTRCSTGTRTVMGLDPSIDNLGWGVILPPPVGLNTALRRVDSSTWHPSKSAFAADRFHQLAIVVIELVSRFDVTDVVVEIPDAYQKRSFATLRTYLRAVGICEGAATATGARVHRLSVNTWKGRTKKSDTATIVRAVFKRTVSSDNESDALGVAMAFCAGVRG